MLSEPIAKSVKEWAEGKGIKQIDISRLTGIDKKNISKILQGTHNPTLETFLMICTAAGLEIRLTETKKK